MKEYSVMLTDGDFDWESVAKAEINEYVWGGEYRPQAYAQVVLVRDCGFFIRLTCFEESPKGIYCNNMDPVYKDSCLEFFAAYKNGGYINCEVNSNGAILSAYGEGRENRVRLDKIAGRFPQTNAEKFKDFWRVTVFMPLDTIEKVYGSSDYNDGDVFYANAYKCGDDCDIPHYGMFNPVKTDKPDFHRPEYFTKFIIKDEKK